MCFSFPPTDVLMNAQKAERKARAKNESEESQNRKETSASDRDHQRTRAHENDAIEISSDEELDGDSVEDLAEDDVVFVSEKPGNKPKSKPKRKRECDDEEEVVVVSEKAGDGRDRVVLGGYRKTDVEAMKNAKYVKFLEKQVEDLEKARNQIANTSNTVNGNDEEVNRVISLKKAMKTPPCVICMDLPRKPTAIRCGHVFCDECIRELILVNRSKAQCPTCRKKVIVSQLVPLFLDH